MTPWEDQRTWWRLYTLIRVIDLQRDRQEFVVLLPYRASDLEDIPYNGRTFILPARDRSDEEQVRIVRDFDHRYLQDLPDKRKTRLSAVDREPYIPRE